MIGCYDYVLGLIPATLGGITALLNLVGFSLTAALPVGATIALGLIGHAMFVRGPVTDPTEAGTPSGSISGGSASDGSASPGASD